MAEKDFTVDLTKPLVFQVGHLGERYDEWVHQPIVSKEGPRFFESEFWEKLTRTEWWVIPVVWLPVVAWFISKSIRMGHTFPQVAFMVFLGLFLWTLVEYMLHRFIFHAKTNTYWGNTIHYFLHGFHHKHPMDPQRLVFPPLMTALICLLIYNLGKVISTPSSRPATFGGGLLGYVIYDLIHYYLHHGQPKRKFAKNRKKYHFNHHFRENKGFGVTSLFWDKVFGTLPTEKSSAEEN